MPFHEMVLRIGLLYRANSRARVMRRVKRLPSDPLVRPNVSSDVSRRRRTPRLGLGLDNVWRIVTKYPRCSIGRTPAMSVSFSERLRKITPRKPYAGSKAQLANPWQLMAGRTHGNRGRRSTVNRFNAPDEMSGIYSEVNRRCGTHCRSRNC